MCDQYEKIRPPEEEPPTKSDLYEARLARLCRIKAPPSRIGELALTYLLYLLSEEYSAMAQMIACEYEEYWNDAQKLDILERMADVDMEPTALMLCRRWLLNDLCAKRKRRLHERLLPSLPPWTR